MKMKTYLPAMNMAIVVITTIMTMKKTVVNHTGHYLYIIYICSDGQILGTSFGKKNDTAGMF